MLLSTMMAIIFTASNGKNLHVTHLIIFIPINLDDSNTVMALFTTGAILAWISHTSFLHEISANWIVRVPVSTLLAECPKVEGSYLVLTKYLLILHLWSVPIIAIIPESFVRIFLDLYSKVSWFGSNVNN